jgi:glucokinase
MSNVVNIAAGIDIGGTNATLGLVTIDGNIIFRVNYEIKNFATPQLFVDTVSNQLLNFCKSNNYRLLGIGIGAPNGNMNNGSIDHAPNMPWQGEIPLANFFNAVCKVPVLLTNDANAAAIGEMIFGSMKNEPDFLMITLGTGLGSGIVANGHLIYGHDGMAGEIGHTIAVRNGRSCGCGRLGCLETYASATGIVRTVNEWMSEGKTTSLSSLLIITSKEIYEAALTHDALAIEAFRYTAQILAKTLADSVAYTSPKYIVLFGGLANAGDFLLQPLKKYFDENVLFVYKNKVKFIISSLPENDAAILGAASLVFK